MKIIVRAFVVALFVTGAAASAHVTVAQQTSTKPIVSKASAFPIPTCPPDDPNGCGMNNPHLN